MKKFLLVTLFITAFSQAQVVDIPDTNFKAKLISLGMDLNGDGEIQVSEAEDVVSLDVSGASISSLEGIQSFVNLMSLNCINNNLSMLDISMLLHVRTLYVSDNPLGFLDTNMAGPNSSVQINNTQLQSIDLSGSGNYHFLEIKNNPELTVLDLTNTQISVQVSIQQNPQLTNIDLSGTQFDWGAVFIASNNALQVINFPSLPTPMLTDFSLAGNQLTSINLQGLSTNQLNLTNNPLLETIDVSGCPGIGALHVGSNPALQRIYMKNGANEQAFFTGGIPSLEMICADETQVQELQNKIDLMGSTAIVSPYCTFFPGGNYNTVSGNITFDADNNGCDSSDPDQPYIKLNLTSGNNNYAVFTSPDGAYSHFAQTGSFNVSVAMDNASLFTITPPLATILFANANNNITTQDFCITANGVQNDLETVIVPLLPARPGFDAKYKIIYKNKGNQVLSGNVNFAYQENELDFVNASVAPDSQSTGSLSWNFSNLYPFESRSVEVTLNVNSPQEDPAVNIGDQLNFSAQVNPVDGDITPGDNAFSIKQTVLGSFDPNDITCLEGEHVNPTAIGKYLHYNINFENTGTAAAENIVVKDMIDLTKFDISSLQVLNASHPMTPRITNDKVEFIFEGINLGASEHGNVAFKIKTKNTLVTGDSVSQKADIYFDYNFPVATNTAVTTFDTLGTNEIEDKTISIYPNPTAGIVNISTDSGIKSVELFDMRGRLLKQSNLETLDISGYDSGVYLLRIKTDKGISTQKLVKQ